MDSGYVAITDNADPMNVVVYRTAKKLKQGREARGLQGAGVRQGRERDRELADQAGRSLIVENNYGYQDPFGPNSGARHRARVRPRRRQQERQGLHEEVDQQRRPRADRGAEALDQDRPDLHLQAAGGPGRPGLLLDRDRLPQRQDRLGQYAGSGLLFNNNYAGLALGPDGTAYLGVIGGIIALRDGG